MKKLKLNSMILLILAFITILSGCTPEKEEVIKMGFVPMKDGDQLIESVKPLADILSKELGVTVEAFTATNYVGVVEALGSGQVDFGFIPPLAYLLANSESNAQVILTALKSNMESNYRSQFLVRKDDDIKDFSDVKGKIVAFVDPSSTSGYLVPGAHLMGEGIDLEKDIEYMYSGGHDKSLQLLLNGDVDIISTFVDVRERYAKDFPDALDTTEILGYTDYIPNISVTVKADMDPELQEKIKNVLLNIADTEDGGPLLQELFDMYGFVEATDTDYDAIRKTAELMNIDLTEAE